MEAFKLEHFRQDHPNESFPPLEQVSDSVCCAVREAIADRLGYEPSVDPVFLTAEIRRLSKPVADLNAESPNFRIDSVLDQQNATSPGSVFLNWGSFESLDQIACYDMMKYFEYLWYPAADDLEIISSDTSWVLSVAHSGQVYFLQLPERSQS